MNSAPLAERLRPHSFDDVIGQQQLLGAGKPLRVAFESGEPHSMILWAPPPGVDKTTLARLMADAFHAEFITFSAVLSGVKEIREAVERAQTICANSGCGTILFVDEVHRFNKAVRSYINQQLTNVIVQIFALPDCFVGANHA